MPLRYRRAIRHRCGAQLHRLPHGGGSDGAGRFRFFLNGEPLLLRGVLDQGYHLTASLTAPSDEALAFDIQAMKDAGFNMLRKHLKVEADRWYYHCDRRGMLVWQDMVSGGGAYDGWETSYKPTLWRGSWDGYEDTSASHQRRLGSDDDAYQRQWLRECRGTVTHLRAHPRWSPGCCSTRAGGSSTPWPAPRRFTCWIRRVPSTP